MNMNSKNHKNREPIQRKVPWCISKLYKCL